MTNLIRAEATVLYDRVGVQLYILQPLGLTSTFILFHQPVRLRPDIPTTGQVWFPRFFGIVQPQLPLER
jgi:hypothetical protein